MAPTGIFSAGEGDSLEEVSVRVQAGFTANNGLVLQQAAKQGLGIVYSTTFLAWRALLDGSLVPVLSGWALPLNYLSALYPASRQLSPKVRALIDFLVAGVPAGAAMGPRTGGGRDFVTKLAISCQ